MVDINSIPQQEVAKGRGQMLFFLANPTTASSLVAKNPGPACPGGASAIVIELLIRLILVFFFPNQHPFSDHIIKPRHKQRQKNKHLPKSKPSKLLIVHRPGIHKNDLHIKKDKQNSGHKVLDRKWIAGIAHTIQSTLEAGILALALSLGTQQMCSNQCNNNEAKSNRKLKQNGQIVVRDKLIFHDKTSPIEW